MTPSGSPPGAPTRASRDCSTALEDVARKLEIYRRRGWITVRGRDLDNVVVVAFGKHIVRLRRMPPCDHEPMRPRAQLLARGEWHVYQLLAAVASAGAKQPY